MNYSEPIEMIENDVLTVGVYGPDENYVLWQRGLTKDVGSEDGIYFEIDNQGRGGFDIIKECTIDYDGIHLVFTDGTLDHFYFPKGFDKMDELKVGLRKIYQGSENILDFID